MFCTKHLHDWAVDAELDFDSASSYEASKAWLKAALDNEDFIRENLFKILANNVNTELKIRAAERFVKYQRDCEFIRSSSHWGSNGLIRAYADSVNTRAAHLGQEIIDVVENSLKIAIDRNAFDWWQDVRNYHRDMEAS